MPSSVREFVSKNNFMNLNAGEMAQWFRLVSHIKNKPFDLSIHSLFLSLKLVITCSFSFRGRSLGDLPPSTMAFQKVLSMYKCCWGGHVASFLVGVASLSWCHMHKSLAYEFLREGIIGIMEIRWRSWVDIMCTIIIHKNFQSIKY